MCGIASCWYLNFNFIQNILLSLQGICSVEMENATTMIDKQHGLPEIENYSADDRRFMQMAIDMSIKNIDEGGGPFGAVIVKDGRVVAMGANRVVPNNDPTAHAEVSAIRAACEALGTFSLEGCDIYSSCEPCPMCLGAIYWAHLDHLYYGANKHDAAAAGFDDQFIYEELEVTSNYCSRCFENCQ